MSDGAENKDSVSQDSMVSAGRLLKVVVPLVLVVVAGAMAFTNWLPQSAEKELASKSLQRLLGKSDIPTEGAIEFNDADGDLVADAPADTECIDPEKLTFAFIPGDEREDLEEIWQPWLAAVAESTGKEVEFVRYKTTAEQHQALRDGSLHITVANTGAVPKLVELSGFVPVSSYGKDGKAGVTMKILAPAGSKIASVKDIKGHKIKFVRPNSNSGFKAAFVLLLDEDLLPERDYQYGFTMSHLTSVEEVASKKAEVVSVASDLLDKAIADGTVAEDSVVTVYESELFPPLTFGYAYNLKPDLREKITKLLTEFDWSGTPLETAYGASGAEEFVALDYKNQFANVRSIDNSIERARKLARSK